MDQPLLPDQADPSRDFFEQLYLECAERAWRTGRGKEFILLLEALRVMRGPEPDSEPDELNRYFSSVCLTGGYRGYLLAVSLSFDGLVIEHVCTNHLIAALAEWIRIRHRPHRYRLADAWRRFWWALPSTVHTRKAR